VPQLRPRHPQARRTSGAAIWYPSSSRDLQLEYLVRKNHAEFRAGAIVDHAPVSEVVAEGHRIPSAQSAVVLFSAWTRMRTSSAVSSTSVDRSALHVLIPSSSERDEGSP